MGRSVRCCLSLSSRERELQFAAVRWLPIGLVVALFTGAWIGNTTTNGSLPVVNALPLSWKPKLENRLLPFKLPRPHFFYREHALNQFFRQNTAMKCTPTKQDYELLLRHSLSRFYTIYLFLAARVPCSPTSARMIQRSGPQQFRSIQILLVFPASAGMIPRAIG